jgi:membrane protein
MARTRASRPAGRAAGPPAGSPPPARQTTGPAEPPDRPIDPDQDGAPPAPAGRWARVVQRLKDLWSWWQRTRAARALARFGAAGGGVLTGGIAFNALFSVFAALTLGWTIFMAVLGGNDALREDVLAAIDANLPGLIDTGDGSGLVDPDDLILSAQLSLTSLAAIVVLLLSASRFMAALRVAVRAVLGVASDPGNLLAGKLRELAAMAGVGLAILLSAVLSLALTSLTGAVLGAVGWEEAGRAVGAVVGVLVSFVVDAAMFVLIVRVLAGVRPPTRDLVWGAVGAAVGMGALRLLGTSVVAGSTERNALLAGFTVLITLLLWVNLLARVVLLAAAWTADPPMPEDDDVALELRGGAAPGDRPR